MNKISACLVVYNEEKLIARCLDSLKGVVDEIILIHDGQCQDQTLEIARRYGAKIFVREHVGCSEEYRPFCYTQASNNWVLQIDADEFLSPELRNNLKRLVSEPGVSAYEFLWPLWDGTKEISVNWPYKICLFRKDKISFLSIIHFVIEVKGKVVRTNYKLSHRPSYNNYNFSSFIRKQLPWARLQASYYLRDFSQIQKFNYSDSDWPRVIKWRQKFPLLLIPFEFFVTVAKNFYSGAYKAGLPGSTISLQAGVYRVAVNYYIYKLTRKLTT